MKKIAICSNLEVIRYRIQAAVPLNNKTFALRCVFKEVGPVLRHVGAGPEDQLVIVSDGPYPSTVADNVASTGLEAFVSNGAESLEIADSASQHNLSKPSKTP